MILVFHIAVALASLLVATVSYFSPSKLKIKLSYFLATATLISGSYLVIMKPSHLVQSCIMGIIYFGIVSFAIFSARRKLANAS